MNNPLKTSKIRDLLQNYNTDRKTIGELLNHDSQRFGKFSRRACGLLLDFSRNGLDDDIFRQLFALAEDCMVAEARDRLFSGERINFTENRAVLHPLWRSRQFESLLPAEESERLRDTLSRMGTVVEAMANGHLPGDPESPVRHIVHIGIGGSLLGPRMLVEAFSQGRTSGSGPQIHFLSSVDPGPRESLLASIDPRETAVIVVSKSFTTSEVLTHAKSVFEWQERSLSGPQAASRRFAVSSRPDRTTEYSIPPSQVLEMGEWTGGRYSLWSPVGVTAAIAMGRDGFERLLEGGASMDRHFRQAPLSENLPVIAGLIDIWHRNIDGRSGWALIPYESRLGLLPSWLQQTAMESNGKGTGVDGQAVGCETSSIVFGDTGTDAQHSFFQAFHQGAPEVAVDFIGVVNSGNADREADARLMSHMLAQATALARGRNLEEVEDEMRGQGSSSDEIGQLAAHRVMPGDRPSNVILMDEFSPEALGSLIVFYEYRVFVQSVIWGINAFDQWGVELGKTLASAIEPAVAGGTEKLPGSLSELGGILNYIHANRS